MLTSSIHDALEGEGEGNYIITFLKYFKYKIFYFYSLFNFRKEKKKMIF